jgi:hypothetical protein
MWKCVLGISLQWPVVPEDKIITQTSSGDNTGKIKGYVTSLLNFGHKLVTVINLLKFKTNRQFAELAVHVIEKEQCTIAGMYGPALLELLDDKHLKCSHFPLKCGPDVYLSHHVSRANLTVFIYDF